MSKAAGAIVFAGIAGFVALVVIIANANRPGRDDEVEAAKRDDTTRPAGYFERSPVERSVRARLKDPDSASFSEVIDRHPSRSFCGFVNARNSFGGYAGPVRFYVGPTGDVYFDTRSFDDPDREGFASRLCREASTPPRAVTSR